MSASELAVRVMMGLATGAALVSAAIPYFRHIRRERARFLDEQRSAQPHNGRTPEGASGDPLEFVAGAGSEPPGPPRLPRSSAAAARKVAMTGEVFARAGASIPDLERLLVWRHLVDESRPFRIAYWWATSFGKFFTLGGLIFVASLAATLGEYSPSVLIVALSISAVLVGLPAVKMHRIAWQALNLAAGVYVATLKGANNADE